jgi:hypothetical protein
MALPGVVLECVMSIPKATEAEALGRFVLQAVVDVLADHRTITINVTDSSGKAVVITVAIPLPSQPLSH